MRAWQAVELGEPQEVPQLREVPDPEPGPGQIKVRRRGAAANFPGALMRRGLCQVSPPMPFARGVEPCGDVVALGHRVRAEGSPPSGEFAEFTVVDAEVESFRGPLVGRNFCKLLVPVSDDPTRGAER
jgi:NADPH2:quinone reductase